MATNRIPGVSYHLQWLSDMLELMDKQPVIVPTEHPKRVIDTKKLLNNDVSGLANTILDFSIDSALVDYTLETSNSTMTTKLNKWLEDLNIAAIGKVPTGIEALAKQYFMERWKGSSMLVLRTFG